MKREKGEIAKIFVSDDKHAIQSLQFLFVKNGNFVLSNRHGDAAHDANFATVVLDYQSEFLTWISGFHDLEPNNKWMYLRSITFGTNKGTYGPYGMKNAVNLKLKEFNFQIGDDRSFGGFHGTKHGNYIESIGLYLNTITSSMINTHKKMDMDMIKVGPTGGKTTGGSVWDEKGKGEIAKILLQVVLKTYFVLSLQFLFVDHNGQFILSDRHGAQNNYSYTTTFNTVVLDYPSEFLIEIIGTYYSNGLRSITFVTNKGTHGPYGGVKPVTVDREIDFQIGNDHSFGTVWDEKGKSEIAKIFIYSGAESYFVNSLQFLFVVDGQFVLSRLHGADYNYSWNTNFSTVSLYIYIYFIHTYTLICYKPFVLMIVLDYPSEFLTGIQGTYYSNGLRSIKFMTNKGVYGPYGSNRISPKVQFEEFVVHLGDDRSFGGFHGTKRKTHIESIGIYMKPVTSSMITNSSSPYHTQMQFYCPPQQFGSQQMSMPLFTPMQHQKLLQMLEQTKLDAISGTANMTGNHLPPVAAHLKWIVDTGASHHMVGDPTYLHHSVLIENAGQVQLPTGTSAKVSHVGDCHIEGGDVLRRVLCVPAFKFNLLSVSQVVLNYPSEFLTEIQDTFFRIVLRSIKFVTNKNVYELYGSDKIDPKFQYKEFNVHLGDDRSFGGFHGTKSKSHIESIGIYMKPVTSSMITNSSDKVVLDYPSEFLIEIKGTYYSNGLRSITFVTNKDTYGSYGGVKPMIVDREIDFQIENDPS
ncbi:hypothetical protein H5410_058841 [Solanum commersonii]|uniref:Jacalin-type lectin domain-containing protein n=1 Tax=Solanum commersonii TaxID=4109 RepID=A0A9J5W0Q6_SOLCO|nr:hypothetical protein H5410_058841 [Solanum commersonii]